MKNKNVAIILAGGEGMRFPSDGSPKQFIKISGKTVLEHTIDTFETNSNIDKIIIVSPKNYIDLCTKLAAQYKKVKKIVEGGLTRQESSLRGVAACDLTTNKLLIHDAIRPFVSNRIINEIIEALDHYKAVDVAIPFADTLIKVNKKIISEIPRRSDYRRGQTPQGFRFKTIKKAYELAIKDNNLAEFTDDCGIVLKYKLGDVYVVDGSEDNIKITYPLDIHIADKIFQLRKTKISKRRNFLKTLKDKKILLFGHSSGIGKEIYTICKAANSTIEGFSRSNNIDIRNTRHVKTTISKYVAKHGKIDFLISTVGLLKRNLLEKISIKDINKQIAVNFTAQVYLVKYAIPYIAEGGSIALFTSSSYTRGRETYALYSASKAALVNFIQAVSEEIAHKKIKVNAICPARTHTPMRVKNFGKEPLHKLLHPKVVALTTLQACLSDLTGQVIDVRKNH